MPVMIKIDDEFPNECLGFLWNGARVEFKSCGHFCGSYARSTLPHCCVCDRTLYDPCGLCGQSLPSSGLTQQAIHDIMNTVQPSLLITPTTTTVSGGGKVIMPLTFNGIPIIEDPYCPPGKMYLKNTKYIR